jgi:hypothetical protein
VHSVTRVRLPVVCSVRGAVRFGRNGNQPHNPRHGFLTLTIAAPHTHTHNSDHPPPARAPISGSISRVTSPSKPSPPVRRGRACSQSVVFPHHRRPTAQVRCSTPAARSHRGTTGAPTPSPGSPGHRSWLAGGRATGRTRDGGSPPVAATRGPSPTPAAPAALRVGAPPLPPLPLPSPPVVAGSDGARAGATCPHGLDPPAPCPVGAVDAAMTALSGPCPATRPEPFPAAPPAPAAPAAPPAPPTGTGLPGLGLALGRGKTASLGRTAQLPPAPSPTPQGVTPTAAASAPAPTSPASALAPAAAPTQVAGGGTGGGAGGGAANDGTGGILLRPARANRDAGWGPDGNSSASTWVRVVGQPGMRRAGANTGAGWGRVLLHRQTRAGNTLLVTSTQARTAQKTVSASALPGC